MRCARRCLAPTRNPCGRQVRALRRPAGRTRSMPSDHNNVATHDELSRLSSGSLCINSLCINMTVDYPPADARRLNEAVGVLLSVVVFGDGVVEALQRCTVRSEIALLLRVARRADRCLDLLQGGGL